MPVVPDVTAEEVELGDWEALDDPITLEVETAEEDEEAEALEAVEVEAPLLHLCQSEDIEERVGHTCGACSRSCSLKPANRPRLLRQHPQRSRLQAPLQAKT